MTLSGRGRVAHSDKKRGKIPAVFERGGRKREGGRRHSGCFLPIPRVDENAHRVLPNLRKKKKGEGRQSG